MKRATLILLIAALLGTLASGLPTLAHPLKVPHENPATAAETGTEYNYISTFGHIIDLAAASQYRSAGERLKELRQASLPAAVTGIFDQYTGLYQQLFTALDNLERQMGEASSLLARNRIEEARVLLDTAGPAIDDAGRLANDIQAATDSLDEKLGSLSRMLPDDPLANACRQLQGEVTRLDGIIGSFEVLERDLNVRSQRLAGLTPVELSLEIAPATAFVGDWVTASGRLKSQGHPLVRRTVGIVAYNITLATAMTRYDGSFQVPFKVPYKYTGSTTFSAAYEPSGNDAAVYLGAVSPLFNVAAEYYDSQLTVAAPETVYPGHSFTISGEVTPGDDPTGRELVVTLHGEDLIDTTVPGQFSLEVTPPSSIPPGTENLTVSIRPQGRYAGAFVTRSVTAVMTNLRVRAETPAIVLLPGTVHIGGIVLNGPAPVGGAPVNINLNRWHATTLTVPDGTFDAEVPLKMAPAAAPLADNPFYVDPFSTSLPFNISPLGWQELKIDAEVPGSPLGAFELKKQVVSVNPLAAGLLAAALAVAWLFLYRRQIKPVPLGAPAAPQEPRTTPPLAPLLAPLPRLTGLRGKVLAAYRSALAAVEKTAGVVMGPDTTLREFLGLASMPSPATRDTFSELTGLAEGALYSGNAPHREAATRAEKLAHNVKEDLSGGAA